MLAELPEETTTPAALAGKNPGEDEAVILYFPAGNHIMYVPSVV